MAAKKALDHMTVVELEDQIRDLAAQQDALRERKRAVAAVYDRKLLDERAAAVLDGMTDAQRDAVARVATQQMQMTGKE